MDTPFLDMHMTSQSRVLEVAVKWFLYSHVHTYFVLRIVWSWNSFPLGRGGGVDGNCERGGVSVASYPGAHVAWVRG